MTWQPFETAPKDETRVLLCWNGLVFIGYYCRYLGWVDDEGCGTRKVDYWQPLPEPPA